MYKIYINDTPLFLLPSAEAAGWPAAGDNCLVIRYPGKAKLLLNVVDMLEKTDRYEWIAIFSDDYDRLCRDFNDHFLLIEAAGGLVFNNRSEVLFIFRRGSWDLPKGKIDRGESPPEAARREVQEETGLQQLSLGELLDTTYHVYREPKGRRVLKRTYWYRMDTTDHTLIPQTEEDIEHAEWMSLPAFFSTKRKVYGNIRDLLKKIRETE